MITKSCSHFWLSHFCLLAENPYIRAVSPSQLIVAEGESVILVFLVATDSDGATWNNRAVTFSFTNRSGVEYSINSNFQNSNPDFPQYFVYTIPTVELSHAGIYSAFAPSMSNHNVCKYYGSDNCSKMHSNYSRIYCSHTVTMFNSYLMFMHYAKMDRNYVLTLSVNNYKSLYIYPAPSQEETVQL